MSAYHWIGLKRQYVCTEDFSSWYPRSSCTWQWQWTDNSSTYYIRRRYFPGNGDCLLKTTSQTLMRWDCSQSSYEYYYHINYICKKGESFVYGYTFIYYKRILFHMSIIRLMRVWSCSDNIKINTTRHALTDVSERLLLPYEII